MNNHKKVFFVAFITIGDSLMITERFWQSVREPVRRAEKAIVGLRRLDGFGRANQDT